MVKLRYFVILHKTNTEENPLDCFLTPRKSNSIPVICPQPSKQLTTVTTPMVDKKILNNPMTSTPLPVKDLSKNGLFRPLKSGLKANKKKKHVDKQ